MRCHCAVCLLGRKGRALVEKGTQESKSGCAVALRTGKATAATGSVPPGRLFAKNVKGPVARAVAHIHLWRDT